MNIFSLTACTLLAASPKSKASDFPLAAAFVIQSRLVVYDVPTRIAKPLPLAQGLVPEEADLSPDKKMVAFNAQPSAGGPMKLFLYHLADNRLEEVKAPADGNHRFPRFADNGKLLYFSAASADSPGGPDNPSRLFEMTVKGRSIRKLETQEGTCEFSPVGLSRGRVAHVSTHCFLGFELNVTDTQTHTTQSIASVSGSISEAAASFDGETLLYSANVPAGRGFFVWSRANRKPRLISTIATGTQRLQPRFVCPRDAVFYDNGQVWMLDTRTGVVQSLTEYSAATGRDIPTNKDR